MLLLVVADGGWHDGVLHLGGRARRRAQEPRHPVLQVALLLLQRQLPGHCG